MRGDAIRGGLALAALALVLGCGSKWSPVPDDQVHFRERSQTQVDGGIRVTAAVPSADETRALFGAPLYRRGVQPVWLEIENGSEEPVSFLPVGVDSEYFTPIEVTGLTRKSDPKKIDWEMHRFFFDRGMGMSIEPGETQQGFLFTRLDEGTKAFNVDVLSDTDAYQFTFFIPVPGLRIDHQAVDWEGLYAEGEIREMGKEALIEALEEQACCTTDKKAAGSGDPLNLVVIGDLDDVYYAFVRAGWDETEAIYRASLMKTFQSFFSGGEYRYSPVSGLYVFGRPQDVAFQKARSNIHERNHLRLWMSPLRYKGKPVWMGQISRDIGVRFTRKTITTHKIDPDVDETREFLLEDLAYSQVLARFGYVGGVGEASFDAPRANLTGDPYITDGYRVVLWLAEEPTAIDDIELLGWRQPPN